MQINNDILLVLSCALCVAVVLQLVISLYMFGSLRSARKEREKLNREMFGLLRKIEGLTASKREQMLQHYDQILDSLASRLPPTVASEAGQIIFEMESKILNRLAELDPGIKDDEVSQRKMDDLIKSMENLEATIISLTSDAVHKVLADGRQDFFREDLVANLRELAA
jgi:hypothetical protein